MKAWIQAEKKIFDKDTAGKLSQYNLNFSRMLLNDTEALYRISADPAMINAVINDIDVTLISDEEAITKIHLLHPNSDLENIDVEDPEIDEIAKSLGLDPHIRADIQIPSRGKQLLPPQENYLMAQISTKKGISRPMWDNEAVKYGKYLKGIDIQRAVIDGKGAAHEFILSRLR